MGRTILSALFAALILALSGLALAADDTQPQWITLRDGYKARVLNALEVTPRQGGERTLIVNFVLSDPAVIADHVKIIDIADQLFVRVVLVPADTKGYKRAAVNLLVSERTTGDTTVQEFEDFHYARRDDAVWLRQAGPEAWKPAQDPAYTPPESVPVVLSSGTVYVDFIGEIFPPPGATKALGIEMRSSRPVTDFAGKYAEMKELWAQLDRAKLKQDGFDLVVMENYGEPRRGHFHVRYRVFLSIVRPAGGDWTELPDTPPTLPVVAGLDKIFEDEGTRLAAAAVASVGGTVPLAARRLPVEGLSASIGLAARTTPGAKKIDLKHVLRAAPSSMPLEAAGGTDERWSPDREYLYAATVGRRVDVYDMVGRRVYTEGHEYLARRDGRHYTEFAGALLICTTSAYYCLRGGIYAVVPTTINGQSRWSSHDVRCQSSVPLQAQTVNTITCHFKSHWTRFQYEGDRGILSYVNSGDEVEFKLVGERGLFSR
jgi:hypothetical protein